MPTTAEHFQIIQGGKVYYPETCMEDVIGLQTKADQWDSKVGAIEGKIPASANATDNKLATLADIASSEVANTRLYLAADATGAQFATKAALMAATQFFSGAEAVTPKKDDYVIVTADEDHDGMPSTYFMPSAGGTWTFKFAFNPLFTPAQMASVNNGSSADSIQAMKDATTAAQTQADKGVADAATAQGAADAAQGSANTNATAITALQARTKIKILELGQTLTAEEQADENLVVFKVVDHNASQGA